MLVAIDVAILPPPDVSRRAIALNAALPEQESQGLRLGDDALPHITLTQHFVKEADLPDVITYVATRIDQLAPMDLTITGPGRGSSTLWMAVEKTSNLSDLHAQLMEGLQRYEQPGGTAAAFFERDARPRDVEWVSRFRRESSYHHFSPHITLGHGSELPPVERATFTATTIAVCHLGRFCTCRRVFRRIAYPL